MQVLFAIFRMNSFLLLIVICYISDHDLQNALYQSSCLSSFYTDTTLVPIDHVLFIKLYFIVNDKRSMIFLFVSSLLSYMHFYFK